MATATVSFVNNNLVPLGDKRQKTVTFYGSLTFSAAADTYAAGGLLALAAHALKKLGPYADRTPLSVKVYSAAGSGLTYLWDTATSKLKIFGGGGNGTTGPTEITDGTALNATTPTISGDVVNFEATFPTQ